MTPRCDRVRRAYRSETGRAVDGSGDRRLVAFRARGQGQSQAARTAGGERAGAGVCARARDCRHCQGDREDPSRSFHAIPAARRPGRRLLLVGCGRRAGRERPFARVLAVNSEQAPVDSTATAACPGGATLSRDAGSREVRLPTRADRCIAGWIQQAGARGENAGGSPFHHSGRDGARVWSCAVGGSQPTFAAPNQRDWK